MNELSEPTIVADIYDEGPVTLSRVMKAAEKFVRAGFRFATLFVRYRASKPRR